MATPYGHCHVRYTGDIDVFYAADAENTERLAAALHEFGFSDIEAAQLARPNVMFRLGVKPVMIELINEISGVTFGEAYAGRTEVTFGSLRRPMTGTRELRKDKAASARPKDLADLSQLPEA